MSISTFILKTIVLVGVGVAGVEYGRRRPNDPWSYMWSKIKSTILDIKNLEEKKVSNNE